jgi:hypothetical protein
MIRRASLVIFGTALLVIGCDPAPTTPPPAPVTNTPAPAAPSGTPKASAVPGEKANTKVAD